MFQLFWPGPGPLLINFPMDRRGRMTDIETHQKRRSDAAPVALEEAFKRFQTWNIYWANAIREKTAAVRGYEKLPVSG
jgi:hypothetical protein